MTEVKLQYEVKSEDVYLHGIQMKLNCHMYDVISKKNMPDYNKMVLSGSHNKSLLFLY